MNICFVNMPLEYYSPVSGGAISTITAELTAEFLRLGHAVQVLTYTDHNPTYDVGVVTDLGSMPTLTKPMRAVDRITRTRLRRPFPRYEQYRGLVRRALRALRPAPDVVIAFNDFAAARVVHRALPHARAVTWLENEPPPHRPRELVEPDAVVAVSDYIRDRTIEAGVPATKIRTILNGVNLGIFHAEGRAKSTQPRVLCVGRLDPNKGFHVALKALAEAQENGCQFETTLAGARWWYGAGEPSEYELELFRSVDSLGGSYVGLVPRDKIADLFRAHDLAFVLSISQEPFGLVVLEAMAAGCAVIASPRGGIPQAAGGAAILVDPDDSAAVATATIGLLKDPEELERWRDRALAHASTASWRVRAEAFVALAESIGVR